MNVYPSRTPVDALRRVGALYRLDAWAARGARRTPTGAARLLLRWPAMPYELFEHTADLGLRVRAPSLERLCVEGARGLTGVLVVVPEAVLARETHPIALVNDDAAALWREWLAELVFLFAVRGFVVASCNVAIRAGRLAAELRGESFDERRHGRGHEVKAVTYHALRVVEDAEGWLGEAILDI